VTGQALVTTSPDHVLVFSQSLLGIEGASHIASAEGHSRDIEMDDTHEYLMAGSRGSGICAMFADY